MSGGERRPYRNDDFWLGIVGMICLAVVVLGIVGAFWHAFYMDHGQSHDLKAKAIEVCAKADDPVACQKEQAILEACRYKESRVAGDAFNQFDYQACVNGKAG